MLKYFIREQLEAENPRMCIEQILSADIHSRADV